MFFLSSYVFLEGFRAHNRLQDALGSSGTRLTGLPAAWGVATGLLGDDFFADDAVLGDIDADAVLCARHYRHACRVLDRAVVQPDAPT